MHLLEHWEEWLEAKVNVPIVQNNSETGLLVSIYIESDESLTFQIDNPSRNFVVGTKRRTFFTVIPNTEMRVVPPNDRSKIRIAVFG